jgi:hypothetical protein
MQIGAAARQTWHSPSGEVRSMCFANVLSFQRQPSAVLVGDRRPPAALRSLGVGRDGQITDHTRQKQVDHVPVAQAIRWGNSIAISDDSCSWVPRMLAPHRPGRPPFADV